MNMPLVSEWFMAGHVAGGWCSLTEVGQVWLVVLDNGGCWVVLQFLSLG